MPVARNLTAALVVALAVAAAVAAGCGGGSSSNGTSRGAKSTPATKSASKQAPAPSPRDILGLPDKVPDRAKGPARPEARRVIRAWLRELRHGHVVRAAHYFALPSKYQNNTPVLLVDTEAKREAVNKALPCGAIATAMGANGAFTIVTFKLTKRPGGACGSGVGNSARGAIKVNRGHIKEWYRLPDQPTPEGPPALSGPAI
jgi:hypothetical protein